MKVFKFIYKATLCATLSATVLTSCVNNWLDLEPADGVEEKEGITNAKIPTQRFHRISEPGTSCFGI